MADYFRRPAEYRAAQAAADLEEQTTDVDGAPGEWDDEAWEDALDEAREKADLTPGKGRSR